MKKLLLLLLPLFMVFSCALEEEKEEPYEPPSVGKISEIEPTGATTYPTTEEEADELLQNCITVMEQMMETTNYSRVVEKNVEDLSYSKDGVKVEGSLTTENFMHNDFSEGGTPNPDTNYSPAYSIKVYGTPKLTVEDSQLVTDTNTFTLNGISALDLNLYVGFNVSKSSQSIRINYELGMSTIMSILRDDGYGAKFSFSFANSDGITIDMSEDSSSADDQFEEVFKSLEDITVTIKVYNDNDEEIVSYNKPITEFVDSSLVNDIPGLF